MRLIGAALKRHSGKCGFVVVAAAVTLVMRVTTPDLAPPVDAAVPNKAAPAAATRTSPHPVEPGPSIAALPTARVHDGDTSLPSAPDFVPNAETSSDAAPSAPANPSAAIAQTVQVQRGDTLISVLVNAGVSHDDAYGAIEALRDLFAPKDLKPGQEIALTFSAPEAQHQGPIDFQLVSLSLQPSVERDLQVTRGLDGGFTAFAIDRPLVHRNVAARGQIDSSLFEATQQAGVPLAVVTEAIRAFSYDVDFQRDIQPGDSFEMVYDRLDDEDGNLAKPGDLLYAALTLSGKKLEIYRYALDDGFVDYFNPRGESVRKALLRTPIDGARITSGFGMRKHPILGYSKMHKGVDFGAPQGTPIYAAGDGVIVKIGPNGAYGNYIRIKHTSDYSTAYAHVSRFAKGLRVGSRVRQGEVIAYVGATGRTTGPHLHYEVLVDNKQVNPTAVKLASGTKLAGADLRKFKATIAEMVALREKLESGTTQTAEAPVESTTGCNVAQSGECN
jgi:murein DD-endopeptidase MepM/ murein hydrolase activator NlpD